MATNKSLADKINNTTSQKAFATIDLQDARDKKRRQVVVKSKILDPECNWRELMILAEKETS